MIISKTDAGQRVVKDDSVQLTPPQRTVFLLVDGKLTVNQLLATTQRAGVQHADIVRLIELGLVYDVYPEMTARENAMAQATAREEAIAEAKARTNAQAATLQRHKQRPPQQRYSEAYPIATSLTASLGLRGLHLNLAVEAACSYEDLAKLASRIRKAVGKEKFAALGNALNDR